MVLLFHIVIAVLSVALSTVLFFSPTKPKLRITYGAVAATLVSGTYLVASRPTHMAQACMSGLLYLGMVSVGIVFAHIKLAAQKDR